MEAEDGRVNSCPWMWKVTSGIWGISLQPMVYWEQRGRRKSVQVSKFGSTVQFSTLSSCILFSTRLKKSDSLNQYVYSGTYLSVLGSNSHQSVDVVDVALRSNGQRLASVHNSLAATTASHDLTTDSNTERETQAHFPNSLVHSDKSGPTASARKAPRKCTGLWRQKSAAGMRPKNMEMNLLTSLHSQAYFACQLL